MKKLLSLLLIASCSATSASSVNELQPLPTTGAKKTATPSIRINDDSDSLEMFVRNFYSNYTGFKSLTKVEIIEWGLYWCELLKNGLKPKDILREIRVYFASEQEVNMMESIFNNARLDICPPNKEN